MSRFKLPNNTRQIGFTVLLILAAGIIGYSVANHSKGTNGSAPVSQVNVTAPAYKAIKYPNGWIEDQVISGGENQLKVVSRANRKSPDATAFVRVEETELAKDFDINKTADEIAQSLAHEIENFSLVNKKVTKVGDFNSIQIRYKQLGEEYILVVVPRPKKAFYLTVNSKAADFEKINGDIESIIKSLAGYIASIK